MNTFLKDCTDIELVQRFLKNGDMNAFGEVYQRYFLSVTKFVYSRVGNREWTEDIVSTTFVTFGEIAKNYNGTSKIENFIIGIALNKIRKFWNEKHMHTESFDEDFYIIKDEIPGEEDIQIKLKKQMETILVKLPLRYQQVLIERFLNNKTIIETSKFLGISESNVRVLQHRALKKATILATELLNNEKNNIEK